MASELGMKGMVLKPQKVFLLIFIVSLAAQIGLMSLFSKPYLSGDEPDYDNIAANLALGKGFLNNSTVPSVDRTPGYPFFLAWIYLSFGHSIFIAKIIQIFINFLTCIVVYLVAKRIFSEKAAFYSAIVVAVYPPLAAMSLSLYSEALFTFLFVLSILFLVVATEKESIVMFSFSGMVIALATHTRPTSAFFPLFILAATPFLNKKRRMVLKGILSYITVFAIVLSPWIIRNFLVFHEFIPFSNKGGIFAWSGSYIPGRGYFDNKLTQKALISTIAKAQGRVFSDSDLMDQAFIDEMLISVTPKLDRYLSKEALRNIVADPAGFLALVPVKIIRLWTGSYAWAFNMNISFGDFMSNAELIKSNVFVLIFKIVMMMLSILILFSACLGIFIERAKWRQSILILLSLIYFTVFHCFSHAMSRLGLPMVPFLIIYSVCGVTYISKWFGPRSCRFMLLRPTNHTF